MEPNFDSYRICTLCPRNCKQNRDITVGVCKASSTLRVGRAALHWWEEPCLVGEQGSGTIFFSYCPLQCVYCQNKALVAGDGIDITEADLERIMLRLQNEEHAANINLVTPSHYAPVIISVLKRIKNKALHIPVVYNTSGYETLDVLRQLDGLVDVYLTDYKYASSDVARMLSHAPDYPLVAEVALREMIRQVGNVQYDDEGLLQQGVIVRHLVLPGYEEESQRVLEKLAQVVGEVAPSHSSEHPAVLFSFMNQFTTDLPDEVLASYGLQRSVTEENYEAILNLADQLGFEDYFWQEGGACEESFIPAFDGTGVN